MDEANCEVSRPKMPDICEEQRRWCKKLIFNAIKVGTALYNESKTEGGFSDINNHIYLKYSRYIYFFKQIECYKLWYETAESVVKKLPDREDTAMIQASMEICEKQELVFRPWTLRLSLETFCWLNFGVKTSFDIHTATLNGYVEQVEILSRVSGIVNLPKVNN